MGERNRFQRVLADRLAAFVAAGRLKARPGSAYVSAPPEQFAAALAANGIGRQVVDGLEKGETVVHSGDRAERRNFADYKNVVQVEVLRFLHSATPRAGRAGRLSPCSCCWAALPGTRQHGALVDGDEPNGAMKRSDADDGSWFADRDGIFVRIRPADPDEAKRCDRGPGPGPGETLLVAVLDDPLGGNRERIAFVVPNEHAARTCKLAEMDARRAVLQMAVPTDGGIDFTTVDEALPGGEDWLRRLMHAVDAKRAVYRDCVYERPSAPVAAS